MKGGEGVDEGRGGGMDEGRGIGEFILLESGRGKGAEEGGK